MNLRSKPARQTLTLLASLSLAACSGGGGGGPPLASVYDENAELTSLGLDKSDVQTVLDSVGIGEQSRGSGEDPQSQEFDAGCVDIEVFDRDFDGIADALWGQFLDCVDNDTGYLLRGEFYFEFYWDAPSVPTWARNLFDADLPAVADAGIRGSMRLEYQELASGEWHSQSTEGIGLVFSSAGLLASKFTFLTDDHALADGRTVGSYTEMTVVESFTDPGAPTLTTTRTELRDLGTQEEIARIYTSRDDARDSRFWVSPPDDDPWDTATSAPVAGGALMPTTTPAFYQPAYQQPDYFGSISSDYGPDNGVGLYYSPPADLYSSSYYSYY